jgi:hypothetical protein
VKPTPKTEIAIATNRAIIADKIKRRPATERRLQSQQHSTWLDNVDLGRQV